MQITYKELADRLGDVFLFNKAPELDENIYDGLENGSLYDECEYEKDGKDTDGTIWYRCTTHDELAPSPDAPCASYDEQGHEIYQWYLIGQSDADYLKRHTDELIFYSDVLDEYVWGVTHFGTPWEGVKLNFREEEYAKN